MINLTNLLFFALCCKAPKQLKVNKAHSINIHLFAIVSVLLSLRHMKIKPTVYNRVNQFYYVNFVNQ